MPLDTLANVKQQLCISGTADDALLTQLQGEADAVIETYCGRSFAGGTFVEYHAGGGRVVFLRNYPVSTVVLKVDPARQFGAETVRPADRYVLHPDRGVVESLDGPFVPPRPGFRVGPDDFPRAVEVTYTAPTGAVPLPVCRAYAELIGHWYRQGKTCVATSHQNVIQQTNGTTVTEYPWGQSGGFRMPAGVLQLLEPYRVPSV